jgi:hypothetical protein
LIVYFDTSALVPIVIEEDTSITATRLWREADRVISSRLLCVEARAALAMARRIGRLNDKTLRRAVRGLEDLVAELDVVEVTADLACRAGTFAETFGLRGYNAIHLASAVLVNDQDLVLATGDRDLLQAVKNVGLGVANLRDPLK